MLLKNKLVWDQAINFLLTCKNKKTHIIHDSDADGISSGLMLYNFLNKISDVSFSFRSSRSDVFSEEHIKEIKQHDPERIIFCDMDPKNLGFYDLLKKEFPNAQALIVDHHHIQEYDDMIFIHPTIVFGVDGVEYCTSKITYDLISEISDASSLSWLAVIGIIGDMNHRFFPKFIMEVAQSEKITLNEDIFESAFAYINEAIDCCAAAGEQDLQAYVKKLADCNNLQEAIKLGNPRADIKKLVEDYISKIELKAKDNNIIWFLINEPVNICSWVATIVSSKYPDKIFFCYRPEKDKFVCSARFQNAKAHNIHLGELLKQASERIKGVFGGGHAPAAGARIQLDSWNEFRKFIREKLNVSP